MSSVDYRDSECYNLDVDRAERDQIQDCDDLDDRECSVYITSSSASPVAPANSDSGCALACFGKVYSAAQAFPSATGTSKRSNVHGNQQYRTSNLLGYHCDLQCVFVMPR